MRVNQYAIYGMSRDFCTEPSIVATVHALGDRKTIANHGAQASNLSKTIHEAEIKRSLSPSLHSFFEIIHPLITRTTISEHRLISTRNSFRTLCSSLHDIKNNNPSLTKRHHRRQTRHTTLPKQPLLLMLRQLARNAMHHSAIVENHNIPLSPSVSVDCRRGVCSSLQIPANASYFCKV